MNSGISAWTCAIGLELNSQLLQIDQAGAKAARDGLGACRRAEFSEYRADVKFNRVFGNLEPVRDLSITETLSQQTEDFGFARGEFL